MKFVSSMNMDNCLTEEGVTMLSDSLASFINNHKIIDKKVFDEVSLKARNLNNKKLVEQSRIARSRCEETKQVLKVRETTIMKAKEEVEAQKAKRISLEELAADTNITPLSPAKYSSVSEAEEEDIWLPQTTDPQTPNQPANDDSNNNSTNNSTNQASKPVQSVRTVALHSRTSSGDNTRHASSAMSSRAESLNTIASSSQEDLLSSDGSHTNISGKDSLYYVSPLAPEQLNESSMAKRRSFSGFTTPLDQYAPFNNLKKPSTQSGDDMSEQDEGLVTVDDNSSVQSDLSKSVVEKLEELGMEQSPIPRTLTKSELRDSVITGSSGSLPR